MKRDCPVLIERFDNLKIKISGHKSQVDVLYRLIEKNMVEYRDNYFKRPSSKLFPENDSPDYDNYQKKETVKNIATNCWKRVIQQKENPIGVQMLNEKIDEYVSMNIILRKKSNPFELEINSRTIIAFGNNENDLYKIQGIFVSNILKNKEILQKLVDTKNKNDSLEKEDNTLKTLLIKW